MKKLMLTALAIVGLVGSSAQGAAAMAAGFGAKAWGFLQASAVPVTLLGTGYEVGKMFGSSTQAINQIAELNKNFTDYLKPIALSPRVLKLAGIESAIQPKTWYGKVWKNICFVDDLTDTMMSKVQKFMLIASIFGTLLSKVSAQESEVIVQQPVQPAQPNIVPAEVQQPVIRTPRRGYRRSGIAARA